MFTVIVSYFGDWEKKHIVQTVLLLNIQRHGASQYLLNCRNLSASLGDLFSLLRTQYTFASQLLSPLNTKNWPLLFMFCKFQFANYIWARSHLHACHIQRYIYSKISKKFAYILHSVRLYFSSDPACIFKSFVSVRLNLLANESPFAKDLCKLLAGLKKKMNASLSKFYYLLTIKSSKCFENRNVKSSLKCLEWYDEAHFVIETRMRNNFKEIQFWYWIQFAYNLLLKVLVLWWY